MKEEIWLDVRSAAVVSTSEDLAEGKEYRVTMQGTFSVWSNIADPGARSGAPEPAPMWPTPDKTNNQVGLDPEFVFAWPKGSSLNRSGATSPRRASGIQLSTDVGATWKHPETEAPYNATEHEYTYQVKGEGHPLLVRFVDRPYSDNYGRVKITIQPGRVPPGKPKKPDDLRKIEGIGPKIAELLENAGIATYAQLASTDVAELERILDDAGSAFSTAVPATWAEQAKLAAAGDWDGLKKLQDELEGGRRV